MNAQITSAILPVLLLLGTSSFTLAGPHPNLADAAFNSPPALVETRGDLPYLAPGRSEKLDLYLPRNRKAGELSPGIVLIHGGGWQGGDKRSYREVEIGCRLAEKGFVAASVNYALKSSGKYPVNLQDCKNAVRYLRAHARELQVDPDRIGVLGGSAGGHLALMVAYTGDDPQLAPPAPYPGVSDRVLAVVDMYGVSDIGAWKNTDPQGNPTVVREVSAGIAAIFGKDPAGLKAASPISHVRANVPATLIFHGKRDTTVDRDQSQSLYEALKNAGADVELVWLQKAGHTFSFKFTSDRKPLEKDLGPQVIEFFKKHLAAR